MRLSHLPLRVTTGAFFLNSGLGKRGLDAESAAGLHGMATGAVPQFKDVSPTTFAQGLSAAEIGVGAALLLPFVSPVVAGAGLTAFGLGFVQLYLKTPGMREPGTLRPTQAGTGIAKDVWLVGTGLALVIDGLSDGTRTRSLRARRKFKAAVTG